MFGLSSDPATTITMSINSNTHMFRAEATPVASTLSCRRSADTWLPTGYVPALAGRYAS